MLADLQTWAETNGEAKVATRPIEGKDTMPDLLPVGSKHGFYEVCLRSPGRYDVPSNFSVG